LLGQSECSEFHFQWRQCTFAGWILLLIIFGGAFLLLVLIIVCCCCCCCRKKKKRGRVEYNQLDNPVHTIDPNPAPPSTTAYQPNRNNTATPKTNEWREKMSAKYGVAATRTSESDGWN
jgi:hypothetical protein